MTGDDFGMRIVHEEDLDDPDMIPAAEAELRDFGEVGEPEALPREDLEAEEHEAYEARDFGTPDAAHPDSQGHDPVVAALGDDGQGDLAPEDLPDDDRDEPNSPDGLFDSQDMPAVDGEAADGDAGYDDDGLAEDDDDEDGRGLG
ncbi:MAG: hypothetical protein J7480_03535 [Microbacteriaceae bacterium]|nr:hypothetical protein [Microbacteriaceae bacterium]